MAVAVPRGRGRQHAPGTARPFLPEQPDLQRRLTAETTLSDIRAAGGSLSELVAALGQLLDSVVYLVDPGERIVARSVPDGATETAIPRLERLLAAVAPQWGGDTLVVVPPLLPARSRRGHVLAPVKVDGETLAYLVVAIAADQSRGDVSWVVQRAAVHLGGEYAAQRRLARIAWNARSNLGRQMIRSTSYDEDLRAAAEYLGVDLTADRMIVFVLERGHSSATSVDARTIGELVEQEVGLEVLPVRGSEGVLLAIAVPPSHDPATVLPRVKSALVSGLVRLGDEQSIAGISSVTSHGQLRRAYREAREVARCIDRFAGQDTRAVGCDELGPARLLVANSDEHSVRLFLHDVLGPLLAGTEAQDGLLRTLAAYFDSGRSIRETAGLLGVHENTVRHRLGRVHELTGLDVAGSSQDQLTVHTALLVLRLQGHRAVPTFGQAH